MGVGWKVRRLAMLWSILVGVVGLGAGRTSLRVAYEPIARIGPRGCRRLRPAMDKSVGGVWRLERPSGYSAKIINEKRRTRIGSTYEVGGGGYAPGDDIESTNQPPLPRRLRDSVAVSPPPTKTSSSHLIIIPGDENQKRPQSSGGGGLEDLLRDAHRQHYPHENPSHIVVGRRDPESVRETCSTQEIVHPSQLLAKMLGEGYRRESLEAIDPRTLDQAQMEILIDSLTRDEMNWELGGDLLSWLASWGMSAPTQLYSRALNAYAANGSLKQAISLLCALRHPRPPSHPAALTDDVSPGALVPAQVYLLALRLAGEDEAWDVMRGVWGAIIEDDVPLTLHGFTIAIAAHTRAGDWSEAVAIFKLMHKQGVVPDVVAYTALLQALRKGKQWQLMEHVIRTMRRVGTMPNARTHVVILEAFLDQNHWNRALSYFYQLLDSGESQLPTHAYVALIRGLGKANKISEAEEVFIRATTATSSGGVAGPDDDSSSSSISPHHSLHVFSAMLSAYKLCREPEKALDLLTEMQANNMFFRTLECNLVLSALAKARMIDQAWQLFSKMRSECTKRAAARAAAVGGGGGGGDDDPRDPFFFSTSSNDPGSSGSSSPPADAISFEIVQQMYGRQGDIDKVESLYVEMTMLGYPYSSYTLCARMKARVAKGDFNAVMVLFRDALKRKREESSNGGLPPSPPPPSSSSSLLSVHVFNLALLAMLRLEKYDAALGIIEEMKRERIRPNLHTKELLEYLSQAGSNEVNQELSRMQAFSAAAAAAGLVLWQWLI